MTPWALDRVQVREASAVLGGGALLAGSWAIVANADHVSAPEARAFAAVNHLPGGAWPVVWVPMQLGSLVGSLAAVGVTWLVSRDRRLTVSALVASQTGYWAAKGVKRVVTRERPGQLLPEVRLRERASGLGYLSGHSAVAFGLATALAPSASRRTRPALYVAAATVAFGRIYGGAHLPLDVAGGIGVGLLAGTVSRWALGLGGAGVPPR
jgi:membrane-associated phospholipid phosphatase